MKKEAFLQILDEASSSWILLVPLIGILSSRNISVTMVNGVYGDARMFLFNAIFGIVVVCLMARNMCKSQVFAFLGKYSMVIYLTHFKVLYSIRRILGYDSIKPDTFPHFFVVFTLSLIVEVIIGLLDYSANSRKNKIISTI